MTVENVISNYRILTRLFHCPSSDIFLVTDMSGSGPLAILITWPTIMLVDSAAQNEFLQKARGGSIQCQDKSVPIRDTGMQDQHPYIVTASSYEVRDLLEGQVKSLDQLLLKMQSRYPGDQRVLLNTLLYAFMTPAPLKERLSFTPAVQEPPVARENAAFVPSFQQAPAPTEYASPGFPIQEPFVPIENSSFPAMMSEPTLRSTSNEPDEPQAAVSPTPSVMSGPTLSSTSSVFQEFVSPPPIMPEPLFRSTDSASPMMPDMIGPAAGTIAPQEGSFTAIASTGKDRAKSWQLRKWQVGSAAAVLLLLVLGTTILHNTLPATNATITINPMSKEIHQTYNVKLVAPPDLGPLMVTGRALSSTSRQSTQTVAATGQGHQDATNASGVMVVSQINLTSPTGNDELSLSIGDNHGVTVTGDNAVQIYNGGVVSIPSHTSPAGSVGNIAAHDMDGPIQILDHYTSAVIGTAYISNPDPFSGGTDAYDYTYVQQSDIDQVSNALVAQLTPGTKAQVKQQAKKGELLDQDPSCTSNVSSDHKANDNASNVTVTVSVKCSALAYTNQDLQNSALQAYKTDGNTQLGNGYSVVGATQVGKPIFVPNSGDSFSVVIDGIWSFQYTEQSQQDLKKSLTGKPSNDALQILEQRKDIQHVTLTTDGGFGTAIPTNLAQIRLIIAKVNGLQGK